LILRKDAEDEEGNKQNLFDHINTENLNNYISWEP
jgi:hypothetical protein